MSEQSWRPLFRTPTSSLSKVLRSAAFHHCRHRARTTLDSAPELRALADQVEALDHANAPLSAVADRVIAAVSFLRATADRLDAGAAAHTDPSRGSRASSAPGPAAGVAARQRLVVAGLYYLVTPVDLVPDFRPGGYVDDVLLLTWVFGAAVNELAPYLADEDDAHPNDEDPA